MVVSMTSAEINWTQEPRELLEQIVREFIKTGRADSIIWRFPFSVFGEENTIVIEANIRLEKGNKK